MVDFSKFLDQPAGLAKRPPVIPVGDYPGIVKAFEYGDSNKNKTPYVRFTFALTDWPDSVPEHEREGIDLEKRQLRRDFFFTEDSRWRLDEFLRSCGAVASDGEISYREAIPGCVGAQILIEVQQYMNEKANPPEPGNQVGKVVGAG